MNDIDRETIIDERKEKAEAAKFKYEKTRQQLLKSYK